MALVAFLAAMVLVTHKAFRRNHCSFAVN